MTADRDLTRREDRVLVGAGTLLSAALLLAIAVAWLAIGQAA